MFTHFDFDQRPLVVIWEMTRACDLACFHCRASADPVCKPGELSTEEARKLIRDIAALKPPIFVMTGGDPLKRADVYELVSYAAAYGLRPALTPSATPLLTRQAVRKLKEAGLSRLAISLDGPTAEIHDTFRGVPGSFAKTLEAIRWANDAGLPIQVNTSLTKRNLVHLEAMADLLRQQRIVLWSVFCLVPTGRGQQSDLPTGEEFEDAFARLYRLSQTLPFRVKTTEGPHYRRYLLQQEHTERPEAFAFTERERAQPWVNDGKGFVFISHMGDVCPSGFFPVSAGNVKRTALSWIYRNAPLFKDLRDSSKLKGKCKVCEFREVCGGSRARAYAVTGDAFAQEPCCVYQPLSLRALENEAVAHLTR
ncbi:MAG TPA: TIGR04053 family radical SAM/SPASM domain-containing protein [Terriglobales bacterium]|nr:TIGR04053 family radical SAM/SPASM domain-containing protein [Terriglobales bacterium]